MTEKQFERWQTTMRIFRKVFRCHQLSERSFHIRGVQLPLCARCMGLLLGFLILGPAVTLFTFGNMYLSLAFIGIMCLDGLLQLWGVLKSDNVRRLITGLLAGYALFSIAVHIVRMIIIMIG